MKISAITLDLDDTLWPIAPVMERADLALQQWFEQNCPEVAAALPIAICAGGGTAASWFWVMQQNPVMAGILGATTLVSALFAWLLLRG